jgi:hypothetical protein
VATTKRNRRRKPASGALRGACCLPTRALPARIAWIIALTAPTTLGLYGAPFHEPFHARALNPVIRAIAHNVNDGASRNRKRMPAAIGLTIYRLPRFRSVQGL